MTDLSVIKNEKLRELVKASHKFNKLPEKDQKKHLKKIKKMSEKEQNKLCKFFVKEAKKEQEKLALLKKIYDKIVALEDKYEKLIKADPEKKQKEKDNGKMDNLLEQLNQV